MRNNPESFSYNVDDMDQLLHEMDLSDDADKRKASALREPRKSLITILLIGETGSGKTSFMSLLVNLFRGNGPLELEEVHSTSGDSGLSSNQSQTTTATLYTITTREGARIQLLDTPGLADTRGLEQDNKHKAEINRAIQEHVATIDAVIILANGSVQRLAVATSYTLHVITAMFPYSILDNIGFIFTNSDDLTLNFEEESLPEELRRSRRWLIQNPLAMLKNYRKAAASSSEQTRLNRMGKKLEECYEESVATLTGWIDWVDGRKVQPTHDIDQLYKISSRIEAHLEATLTSLSSLSAQRTQCENLSTMLENNKQAKQALEEFVKQQTSPLWERQVTPECNTICIVQGCHSNCHTPCNIDFVDSTSELGRLCQVFGGEWTMELIEDGNTLDCEVCGHFARDHRHYNHINVLKKREMDPATKQKLDTATSEQGRLEAARAATQRKINEINNQAFEAQETIRSLVDDFNGLSLSKNFAGHMNSAIQMLMLRRKGLEGNPNAQQELVVIDQSVQKFQQKLDLLANASFRRRMTTAVGGVLSGAARFVSGFGRR